MKFITVFTPTYNRAYTLDKLYESLKRQTNQDFLWLIIDDGSTDNTEQLVKSWIVEGIIDIEYHKQINVGKSMAHNHGVKLTKTELFTCVDSDDYLTDNAIEEIQNCWESATENNIGILAFKKTENIEITKLEKRNIGSNGYTNTTLDYAYRYLGLSGDTMLIFRTDIISKYEFPYFEGEKFVPEAYLFDLLDTEGKLIVLEKAIYICEYLEDGYTKNMAKLLKNNCKGYLAFIEQRLRMDQILKYKFLDSIRYVAMAIAAKKKKIISESVYPGITMISYPFGFLFYIIRYRGV